MKVSNYAYTFMNKTSFKLISSSLLKINVNKIFKKKTLLVNKKIVYFYTLYTNTYNLRLKKSLRSMSLGVN